MNVKEDFLVEIGTEELPPKALSRLSKAFADGIATGLSKAELKHQSIEAYAAPRRLAVIVRELQTAQADKNEQRRGPALQAAFDEEGNPTKAAIGFAKSCGLESVDALERMENKKGAWLVYQSQVPGKSSSELIPAIVSQSLDKLPIPKRMRWGTLATQFVRPVHWVVMLLGDAVIDAEILSVKSDRFSQGHRFHHPKAIKLKSPKDYVECLESQGQVIVDFNKRRDIIRKQVVKLAKEVKGSAVIDADLLDEVTSMVEWPVALLGNFEKRFLQMPPEVLITTMKANQKYFYIIDKNQKLMPHFITVSNIDSKNMDVVRQGNERVVRPRLVDAEFFWKQDQKLPLADYAERLKHVVFQAKLGSLFDKMQRTVNLSEQLAAKLECDKNSAMRAATLAKCDLMTDMVGEFPSLQGIIGEYYAKLGGEKDEIAAAIKEQYQPRFAGDTLPKTQTGQVLAIADKLDTLAGIFAIGQIPTGDKDPFGLRRAALGVLRIMIEGKLDLSLSDLIEQALHNYIDTIEVRSIPEVAETLYQFMMERLRTYYADQEVQPEVFESVLSLLPSSPFDFDRRIHAVMSFKQLPEAESLAVANKRIANILKKAEGESNQKKVKLDLFSEEAEKNLAKQLHSIEAKVAPEIKRKEYQLALANMAGLRESVDTFFDDVMVMAEDEVVRRNRLALLAQLRSLFLQVADISQLHIS